MNLKRHMLPLLAAGDKEVELRQKLYIHTNNPSDVIILKLHRYVKQMGINELIGGFYTMFKSLSSDNIQEPACILVLVGENCGDDYIGRTGEVNKALVERNSRSRIILRPPTSGIASYN